MGKIPSNEKLIREIRTHATDVLRTGFLENLIDFYAVMSIVDKYYTIETPADRTIALNKAVELGQELGLKLKIDKELDTFDLYEVFRKLWSLFYYHEMKELDAIALDCHLSKKDNTQKPAR